MARVSPFLWISHDAEAALALYERVFARSGVRVSRSSDPAGALQIGTLEIGSSRVMVFNGEAHGVFSFTEALSLYVSCEDQDEVDRIWDGLCEGGRPGVCGWLVDRFGVSWQVVPRCFEEMMAGENDAARTRAIEAMLSMSKLDCDALHAAYDGAP